MALRPDFLSLHQLGPTVQLLVISGLVTRTDAHDMLAQANRQVGLSPCLRHTFSLNPTKRTEITDAASSRCARRAVIEAIRSSDNTRTHPKRLNATAHLAAAGRLARSEVQSLIQAEITRCLVQRRRINARAQRMLVHI